MEDEFPVITFRATGDYRRGERVYCIMKLNGGPFAVQECMFSHYLNEAKRYPTLNLVQDCAIYFANGQLAIFDSRGLFKSPIDAESHIK